MKILGIDYGEKYVGLAVTDDEGGMAFPYRTITVKSPQQLMNDLERIVEYEGVRHIVLGYPLTLRGEEGASSAAVQRFKDALEEFMNVPVTLIDERLSTQAAQRVAHEGGADEHAVAAQKILETYLSQHTPS